MAAARRLWERDGGSGSAQEVAADVERVCARVAAELTRWIGTDGYQALLDRALGTTRATHPALLTITCRGGEEAVVRAAIRSHGADKVSEGMEVLLAEMIGLLSRIIGEDMAVQLVRRIGASRPHGSPSADLKGGLDG